MAIYYQQPSHSQNARPLPFGSEMAVAWSSKVLYDKICRTKTKSKLEGRLKLQHDC